MDALDAIGAIWPIALGFVTLVIVLAKMHADIEQLRRRSEHCLSCGIIEINKLGAGMSEQQEQQPVILKIDDQEYDVNELGNDTKVHYVQVVNLRKQLADLQNQIAAAQQQSINLQVALGFRENALRESIQVVEEPEAEVVN
jgi:hypothetical protein